MNIALEHTEEYVNGVKKNEYGDAFIRGNNGQSIIHVLGSRRPTQTVMTWR
jgi:small nuclear ribonucleoprotein (snRNP)-like protein